MSKKVDYKVWLRRLYAWSAVAYIGLAFLAAAMMSNISYQLTLGHLAKDELASRTSTVLVPASQAIYDLPLKWAVVAIMVLSAIVPILYLTRWQKRYDQGIKKRALSWRWVDLAITSALMVEIIALMSGLQDVVTLKILAALVIICFVLGWLAERQTRNNKSIKPMFITGLVAGCLPWVLIAVYAVATPFYASVRASWYIYGLYASSLGTFLLLSYNQWRQHQKYKQWKDYWIVERNYAAISLLAKVAFAAILIIGLKK